MLFGNQQCFAIEVSDPQRIAGWLMSHFQFWLGGTPVGDWDDMIPFIASIRYMADFCSHQHERIRPELDHLSAGEVFNVLYEQFFYPDAGTTWTNTVHYREYFHMDDIGMSSIADKYGIILVRSGSGCARIVWKKWNEGDTTHELATPDLEVERVGQQYVEWGSLMARER